MTSGEAPVGTATAAAGGRSMTAARGSAPGTSCHWWGAILILVGAILGGSLFAVGLGSALGSLPALSREFDASGQPRIAGFAAGIVGAVAGLILPTLLGIGGGAALIIVTAVRRVRARNALQG